MRISFNRTGVGFNKDAFYAKHSEVFKRPIVWSNIFRKLKEDCGSSAQFETWAKDEWGITLLRESPEYPQHITGLDIPEENITMLLLRFSK